MGKLVCERHGRVGLVETCLHVGREIDGGRLPSGHRLRIISDFFVCDDCFNALRFERFADLAELTWDEIARVSDDRIAAFETPYDAMEGRRIFCSECVAELGGRDRVAAS